MRFKNCGRLFSINIFPLSFFTSSILFFLFPYAHTRRTITSLEATSSVITSLEATSSVITTHRPWSSVVDHPSHPLSYSLSLSPPHSISPIPFSSPHLHYHTMHNLLQHYNLTLHMLPPPLSATTTSTCHHFFVLHSFCDSL